MLINNAGAIWAAPLAEYPEAGWDKVFDLNVKGSFLWLRIWCRCSAQEAVPVIPRASSMSGLLMHSTYRHETYAYSSSKAALHHLTRHLASQLASRHITANIIAPGVFPSKMLATTLEIKGMEAMVEPVPLKRLTGDSDMAGAAIYLASKAGAYVTGAVIPVDGGMATTL